MALFRERSSANVVLYAGGAPFPITNTTWLNRFGGAGRVRVVPDGTIAAFNGLPDEGTLLREWSDARVWRIMSGARRWIRTPDELENWGGFPSVRIVPDGALAGIPIGQPLPVDPPRTWSWLNMGKPSSANLRATMGAISVKDTPTAPQRPMSSSRATTTTCGAGTPPAPVGRGQTWASRQGPTSRVSSVWSRCRTRQHRRNEPTCSSPVTTATCGVGGRAARHGSGPTWASPDRQDPGLMGAVTVQDSPTSRQRPHVFIEGNDYNLWCFYFTGTNWAWTNMGKPLESTSPGPSGRSPSWTRPHRRNGPPVRHRQRRQPVVSVVDRHGMAVVQHGQAAHRPHPGPMGAVTVKDSPTPVNAPCLHRGQRLQPVVLLVHRHQLGVDEDGQAVWSQHHRVGWRCHRSGHAHIAARGLFVTGNDGNLWTSWLNGPLWRWANTGRPPTAQIRGLMGAVAVQDTTTAHRRPHVFVEANDYNLWCYWSA